MHSNTHRSDGAPREGAGSACCGKCSCGDIRSGSFDPRLAAGAAAAFILLFAGVILHAVFSLAGVSLAGELLALTRSAGLPDAWGAFLGVAVASLGGWSLLYAALRRFVPLYRGDRGVRLEVVR